MPAEDEKLFTVGCVMFIHVRTRKERDLNLSVRTAVNNSADGEEETSEAVVVV